MNLTDAAVQYAQWGFKVFPARVMPVFIKGKWHKAKTPHTFHGHKQASSDPDEVERLFTGKHENIKPNCRNETPDILGMVHDKFLVIDVDVKHNSPGLETFERIRPYLPKPLAKVQTSSGGFHWYYPPPEDPKDHKRNTKYLPGVDVLIGPKGWIAVPPSQGYRFIEGSMEQVNEELRKRP